MGSNEPTARPELRWRLTDHDEAQQPRLFDPGNWHPGRDELSGLELMHVHARKVINAVHPQSRMPFRWTINAYRGCSHACVYCFARPTHEYLGLDVGEDFDRRIVVKVNAVECVRSEIAAKRWAGEHIAMGTNTDPYQPVEGRYRLTKGIIGVLSQASNPFSIVTKSTLIERDIDLLADAAHRTDVTTQLSIGSFDPELWRAVEPHTPRPQGRMETVPRLNTAGVPCGVLIAPVIPGLSDGRDQLRSVVKAAVDAGATHISAALLSLPPGTRELFMTWLHENHPHLLRGYEQRYRSGRHAPKHEQQTLTATIRELVREAGGTRGRSAMRGAVRSRAEDQLTIV